MSKCYSFVRDIDRIGNRERSLAVRGGVRLML